MDTVTLICGVPNAGKTTYSERYENVIHFDNVRHRSIDEQFRNCDMLAAKAKGSVCVEGVYNSVKRRKEFLAAVRNKDAKKVCVWMDTPAEVCARRLKIGGAAMIVFSHFKNFEEPTKEEGWDEIIRIKY